MQNFIKSIGLKSSESYSQEILTCLGVEYQSYQDQISKVLQKESSDDEDIIDENFDNLEDKVDKLNFGASLGVAKQDLINQNKAQFEEDGRNFIAFLNDEAGSFLPNINRGADFILNIGEKDNLEEYEEKLKLVAIYDIIKETITKVLETQKKVLKKHPELFDSNFFEFSTNSQAFGLTELSKLVSYLNLIDEKLPRPQPFVVILKDLLPNGILETEDENITARQNILIVLNHFFTTGKLSRFGFAKLVTIIQKCTQTKLINEFCIKLISTIFEKPLKDLIMNINDRIREELATQITKDKRVDENTKGAVQIELKDFSKLHFDHVKKIFDERIELLNLSMSGGSTESNLLEQRMSIASHKDKFYALAGFFNNLESELEPLIEDIEKLITKILESNMEQVGIKHLIDKINNFNATQPQFGAEDKRAKKLMLIDKLLTNLPDELRNSCKQTIPILKHLYKIVNEIKIPSSYFDQCAELSIDYAILLAQELPKDLSNSNNDLGKYLNSLKAFRDDFELVRRNCEEVINKANVNDFRLEYFHYRNILRTTLENLNEALQILIGSESEKRLAEFSRDYYLKQMAKIRDYINREDKNVYVLNESSQTINELIIGKNFASLIEIATAYLGRINSLQKSIDEKSQKITSSESTTTFFSYARYLSQPSQPPSSAPAVMVNSTDSIDEEKEEKMEMDDTTNQFSQ